MWMLPRTPLLLLGWAVALLTFHPCGEITTAAAQTSKPNPGPAPAPSASSPQPPQAAAETSGATPIETLRTLFSTYDAVNRAIQEQQAAMKSAAGTVGIEAAQRELQELEARKQALQEDFLAVASGVTTTEFHGGGEEEPPLTLEEELRRLFTPMVTELRKLSKKPRALQEMQDRLADQERREALAHLAQSNVAAQLQALADAKEPRNSELIRQLTRLLDDWKTRQREAESRILALKNQIVEVEGEASGLMAALTGAGKNFLLTRGRNILFAILAFLAVFFSIRLVSFQAMRMVPASQKEKLGFFSRLLGLLSQSLSLLLATAAALGVLYASGDWLLGGLAMLIVIGLALAAKNGLTTYFEQVRMILNLGSAREGERVVIDGVPWRVGRINLQTRLTNPCLDGPGLQLPLESLMKMVSRPSGPEESWFPCRSGQFVLLAPDLLARVEQAGPDFVQVRYRGGITRQVPTVEFVKLQPENLSEGFVLSTTLGLDYRHQSEITSTIPARLETALRAGLLKRVTEDHLLGVTVAFKEAGQSSLDLLLLGRFAGEAAEQYLELRRVMQQIAVDTCTAEGWSLAFPQLVMRRAGE